MCHKLDCLYLVGEKDEKPICDMLYEVLRWVERISTFEILQNLASVV